MTLDELRAAVKVKRDGSVVMRKSGRVVGRIQKGVGTTGYAWAARTGEPSRALWAYTRAAALDALLRAHLEHEHG